MVSIYFVLRDNENDLKFAMRSLFNQISTRCRTLPTLTPNANMADHSVGPRDELHESEASEASVFCLTMLPLKIKVHMNVVPRNTMNTNGETEN